ncbi:hypothetical protein [Parapedobacter sp. 10938]|uniref:hypothetical protein n=1 Tax=Parapedobacter flavus TaxID=3110225 RepID=UPI002DBACD48|nr:hypothetical protein [Parapedobacter sp. 10938]MEC3879747.1 hypothetical protein [Parapedobacter sp. 10938]
MEILQLLDAVNTPDMLKQLLDYTMDIMPADGWNAVGNNPLIPDNPISDLPTISIG